MDQNALNYMECCPGTYSSDGHAAGWVCVPEENSPDCCEYTYKGCMDETALNYMECCSGDPNCEPTEHKPDCCRHMRYRCKGPRQQVSIRERANGKTDSSCVEDPNGEFETLQACRESCEAGYGPGYIPDAGTADRINKKLYYD